MAWIQSHQTLRHHPKLHEAATELGISAVTMVGHLHFLWWWCLDYAPDGNLTRHSSSTIAQAAGWMGDPEAFVGALRGLGDRFISAKKNQHGTTAYIHGWQEYAGRLMARRTKAAKHMREVRAARTVQSREDHERVTRGPRVDKSRVRVDKSRVEKKEQVQNTTFADTRALVSAVRLDNGHFSILPDVMRTWTTAYPAVDVSREVAAAYAWVQANPKNKKSNWQRFLVNWLKRAQDNAPARGGVPPPTPEPELSPELKRIWDPPEKEDPYGT